MIRVLSRMYRHFNSHPHEEDDEKRKKKDIRQSYFNSHPHEEDDIRDMREVINGDISTHILTRRMTRRA